MVEDIIDNWSPDIEYKKGSIVRFLNKSYILVKEPINIPNPMPLHSISIKCANQTLNTKKLVSNLISSYEKTYGVTVSEDTEFCWQPL